MISEATKLPVYNLAINMLIGLDYMVEQTKRFAKPGDTVIMPLEYELFTEPDDRTVFALTYQRLFSDPPIEFSKLNKIEWLSLLKSIFFQNPFDTFFKYIQYARMKHGLVGFRSTTINDFGDRPGMPYMGTKLSNIFPNQFKPNPKNKKLFELASWCKENKINFWVSFVNTVTPDPLKNPELNSYNNGLLSYLKNNGVQVLGKPSDFYFPEEDFGDMRYHLNDNGAIKRTKQLIELIKLNRILNNN